MKWQSWLSAIVIGISLFVIGAGIWRFSLLEPRGDTVVVKGSESVVQVVRAKHMAPVKRLDVPMGTSEHYVAYADTANADSTFKAEVSYHSSLPLDTNAYFVNKFEYPTYTPIAVRESRWSVGLVAGYGYVNGGKGSPFIGVGVSYRLIGW